MSPADPARRLEPVVRLAPAKVNLTLAVVGTRADGFHDLHSVMVPLDLADRLSVAVLPPGGEDSLHVTGHDPGPAAAVVEPGLVPFKRALLRLLGRPVGLSGSGPTHWALYPSLAEAAAAAEVVRGAVAAGTLPAPGPRPPFVAATRILSAPATSRPDQGSHA